VEKFEMERIEKVVRGGREMERFEIVVGVRLGWGPGEKKQREGDG